jgi:hypothetical protein
MSQITRADHSAAPLDLETSTRAGLATPPSATVEADAKVVCNACPVLCRISQGRSGACDRYANVDGALVRVDPLLVLAQQRGSSTQPSEVVAFAPQSDASLTQPGFVTGIGASSTYPDYKPAPFIVSSRFNGVDLVTVVTEGIFSYCSFRIKIDTDRFLGSEQSAVRCQGERVGHVTTAEYGSQMLSLGGVHHLTGNSKKEGRVSCEMMLALGNQQAVDLEIEGGASIRIQAGRAPIVNGVEEQRMRVGCGSATIGIFAQQWLGLLDEVIVVDDHITGVLSEHQAGRYLDMPRTGIRIRGRKSTPGRYFQVADPGTGWGGTDLIEPLAIIESIDPALAWPGLRLLMVSTTGEHSAYFVLDEDRRPVPAVMPEKVQKVVDRIGENCEPSLTTVLFVAGAGGSLRAGATDNPVLLTRAIKNALVNVTCGGAPTYIWPGGGITLMVDVARMPANSFGYVPTPAIVAPLEFSMKLSDYEALGGHMPKIRSLEQVLKHGSWHADGAPRGFRLATASPDNPWPLDGHAMLG